jgi:hypothetical protein
VPEPPPTPTIKPTLVILTRTEPVSAKEREGALVSMTAATIIAAKDLVA